ncbi:hypothetical protein ABW19_dt0205456 [Dactylella cylindrospora]|nr:hypothetical protein ABW19_dt0205456 [Dactylella cylindrospora]
MSPPATAPAKKAKPDKPASKNESKTAAALLSNQLESEVIPIKVGQGLQRTTIYCHKALLKSANSHSLNALVSGKYREGTGEHGIDFKDDNVETVKRLVTFLYTGDYHVPKPTMMSVVATIEPKDEKASDKDSETEDDKKIPKEARPLTPISRHLQDVRLPTWRENTEAGQLEFMERKGRTFAFGPLMLAHAQVFVLADYHGFEELMKLSLQKLTQVMVYSEASSDNLSDDFIPLISYTYRQELDRPARLRSLVAQFASLHYHELEGPKWEECLEEGGTFMRDLHPRIARRLLSHEVKAGGFRGRLVERQLRQKKAQSRAAQVRDTLSI